MIRLSKFLNFGSCVILSLTLTVGCGPDNQYEEPPPPKVTTAKPVVADITDFTTFTGTVESANQVEVRARVKGELIERLFTDGQDVEEGAPLFRIEREFYEATLAATQAQKAAYEAQLIRNRADLAREQELFDTGASSQAKLDAARAAFDSTKALIDQADADIRQATLDLSYTEIYAPIAGRVGERKVDVGNLVGDGQSTLLVTIIQYDPIYVYFSMSEREFLILKATIEERALSRNSNSRSGEPPSAGTQDPPDENIEEGATRTIVRIATATDEGFPFEGTVDFADFGVDPTTGTFRLRARLDNPLSSAGLRPLVPGLYVRVRVPLARRTGAIMIPEQAIGTDQRGKYVWVVDNQNVVEYRSVQLGPQVENYRVIVDGLSAEDRIITLGLQRARPGATVEATDVQLDFTPPAPVDDAA